jgi:hypothetical protein
MTALDDSVKVFRLACLTEDLDRSERAALKREAKRLERRWNARTITNRKHLEQHGPIDLKREIP